MSFKFGIYAQGKENLGTVASILNWCLIFDIILWHGFYVEMFLENTQMYIQNIWSQLNDFVKTSLLHSMDTFKNP